ncbi:MAG: TetR/AcrR family transcriptional regulator [Desulfobacteraceae bacterium]|nr:TetR/AcrR family transcriptional regulator [Desulfobacteraceae bacterium]MBC2757583.1 TetR/AcrR family transcriptional regulator [Desulfobacteraceae bacterium]
MPRIKDHEDKKNQILEALNQCLQEKPFDQTSIKDIARAADVNHGLLHYYFKNKEDILTQYIKYVIDHYKTLFNDWLTAIEAQNFNEKELIEEFFDFMNSRITLNKKLSKVFIEIWEIAAYNSNIRSILQQAYREWIDTLSEMLNTVTKDPAAARQVSAATVAFLEGMALFSIILTPDTFDFNQVLTGFQKKIIESL